MYTVYSEDHRLRDSQTELCGGELVAPFECPARVDYIRERAIEVGLGEIRGPDDFGRTPVERIHDPAFLDFLSSCWQEWKEAGHAGEAIATAWPARGMAQRCPTDIDGKLGYFALAAETSISAGTWEASVSSVNVALTAQVLVGQGERGVFALCRPPGHHAAADLFGGYCFINNAAVATQAFLDQGADRVAVLDIDFHHGNGTQSIFYDRSDVLFISLHGDPRHAYPYFLGYPDETGHGEGEGFNLNLPMLPGASYDQWGLQALETACRRIDEYAPDALVVSLGVDTYKDDPISFFKLNSDDYKRCGARLARLHLPTLFVMEGGYAVAEIGVNAVNVLSAFESGG